MSPRHLPALPGEFREGPLPGRQDPLDALPAEPPARRRITAPKVAAGPTTQAHVAPGHEERSAGDHGRRPESPGAGTLARNRPGAVTRVSPRFEGAAWDSSSSCATPPPSSEAGPALYRAGTPANRESGRPDWLPASALSAVTGGPEPPAESGSLALFTAPRPLSRSTGTHLAVAIRCRPSSPTRAAQTIKATKGQGRSIIARSKPEARQSQPRAQSSQPQYRGSQGA